MPLWRGKEFFQPVLQHQPVHVRHRRPGNLALPGQSLLRFKENLPQVADRGDAAQKAGTPGAIGHDAVITGQVFPLFSPGFGKSRVVEPHAAAFAAAQGVLSRMRRLSNGQPLGGKQGAHGRVDGVLTTQGTGVVHDHLPGGERGSGVSVSGQDLVDRGDLEGLPVLSKDLEAVGAGCIDLMFPPEPLLPRLNLNPTSLRKSLLSFVLPVQGQIRGIAESRRG